MSLMELHLKYIGRAYATSWRSKQAISSLTLARLFSGGSRILKRGVLEYFLRVSLFHPAREAYNAGGFGGPPPGNFSIFSFLILNLMQSVSKWKLGIYI